VSALSQSSGSLAFDTNVLIAVLEGNPDLVEQWGRVSGGLLLAPVLGELLYEAQNSGRRLENERRIMQLAKSMTFIACDQRVCTQYGQLKAALKAKGCPIPENDMWIAACCRAHDATLVTRDAHFGVVPDLSHEEW